MLHLNLNKCEDVTELGYIGNSSSRGSRSHALDLKDDFPLDSSLAKNEDVCDIRHFGCNIGSLKTLTTLQLSGTAITDACILGKMVNSSRDEEILQD